mgnify:CR=1 FL=1
MYHKYSATPSWDTYGSIETVDGTIPYVRWDTHTHWDKPNPNTNNGNTECLRIRGDKIVDSKCDRTHGPKRRPYPQPYGWICEFTPEEEPPTVEPTVLPPTTTLSPPAGMGAKKWRKYIFGQNVGNE